MMRVGLTVALFLVPLGAIATQWIDLDDPAQRRLRRKVGSRRQRQQNRVVSEANIGEDEFTVELQYEVWENLLRKDYMSMNPTKSPIPLKSQGPTQRTETPIPSTKRPVKAPIKAPIPSVVPIPPLSRQPIAPVPKSTPPRAPSTKAPATKAPVSKAPVINPPIVPITTAPTSKAPVSKAPVSKAPVSKAPVSKAPVSKAPVSKAPVTKAPVTKAPVTNAPVTNAPVTKAPVSKAPVTATPVTKAPVSRAPVTVAPVATPTSSPVAQANLTLLDLVQSTPELTTLRSAIVAADDVRNISPFLAQVLDDPNSSLTVFAPTNSAFSALSLLAPGYLEKLQTPEYGLHLFSILSYHITLGRLTTANFPVSNLNMLDGGNVNITGTTGAFQVQSSSPRRATLLPPPNILATNGVAHLVDNVLLPPFVGQNILTALQSLNADQGGRFSTFFRLISAGGFENTLANANEVTLMAPTNDALTPQTVEFLLRPGNEDILQSVLTYHVLTAVFNFASVSDLPNILLEESLQGENVVIGLVRLDDSSISITFNRAIQVEPLFFARDGIGYVIDSVLIPPDLISIVPASIKNVEFDPVVVATSIHATP